MAEKKEYTINEIMNSIDTAYKLKSKKLTKKYYSLDKGNHTISTGTYIVDSDIFIPKNATLTIEPNTNLLFARNAGIFSEGVLKAEKINFIPYNSQDKWRNITLSGEKSNESSLINCAFSKGSGRLGFPYRGFFYGNEMPDDYYQFLNFGGGLLLNKSSANIEMCVFKENNAWQGGGILILDSKPNIYGNTIIENKADSSGGGICLLNSDINIKNNLFISNKPDNYKIFK